jgi:DNA polymerase (family X)
MTSGFRLNRDVADRLRQLADLLEPQDDNPYRVAAYRRAADTLALLDQDLRELVQERGIRGLLELPGIGEAIAGAIYEMLQTGRWSHLERLRGEQDPVQLFQSVPGLGPELARRIHETLEVDSLEALETAAYDGRLETVPGVGERRAAAVRAGLSSLLDVTRARRLRPVEDPGVAVLLDVDREYREKAAAGRLPTITPKRFNPQGASWLPVLHTRRGRWTFTALYSNTARAHQLGRTHDWVVMYFHDRRQRSGQFTVVTQADGPLVGQRVVRGREAECRAFQSAHAEPRAQVSA